MVLRKIMNFFGLAKPKIGEKGHLANRVLIGGRNFPPRQAIRKGDGHGHIVSESSAVNNEKR